VKECVAGNRPAREVSGLKATIGHLLTLAQGDTSTISQTVATTPGDQYSLSFNLANPVSGTPNFFNVTFSNSSFRFTNFGTAFGWPQFVLTTVATSNQTQLSFTFRNDPSYWFLDNVNVQQREAQCQNRERWPCLAAASSESQRLRVVGSTCSSFLGSHDLQASIKNGGFICCRTFIKNVSPDPADRHRYDISHNVRHRKRVRIIGENISRRYCQTC
jgi:Protein of unknown function (DUF642)